MKNDLENKLKESYQNLNKDILTISKKTLKSNVGKSDDFQLSFSQMNQLLKEKNYRLKFLESDIGSTQYLLSEKGI